MGKLLVSSLNRLKITFFLCCIISICTAYPAAAEENYGVVLKELEEANSLFEKGEIELACNKFEEILNQDGLSKTLEKNTTFYLGKCLLQLSQYKKALKYFKDLATRLDPEAEVPILETARTYLKLGEFAKAEHYFELLLKDPSVSDRMKKMIEGVLNKLPSKTKIQHTVSAGFTGDTNVNSGPANSTIQLFNLPFELADNNLPQKDVGSKTSLNTTISKVLNTENFVSANIGVSDTSYFNHSQFDANSFFLSGTWRHKLDDWLVNTSPYYSYQWLDRQSFSQVLGVSVSTPRSITPSLIFSPYANVFNQKFHTLQSRSNTNTGGGISLVYRQNDTLTWSTQLGYNHSNARNNLNSNDRVNWNIRMRKQLHPLFNYNLGFSINNSAYRLPASAFNSERYDIQYTYSGGAELSLDKWGLEQTKLVGNINHINGRSNHPIYQRNRTIYGLQLVKNF